MGCGRCHLCALTNFPLIRESLEDNLDRSVLTLNGDPPSRPVVGSENRGDKRGKTSNIWCSFFCQSSITNKISYTSYGQITRFFEFTYFIPFHTRKPLSLFGAQLPRELRFPQRSIKTYSARNEWAPRHKMWSGTPFFALFVQLIRVVALVYEASWKIPLFPVLFFSLMKPTFYCLIEEPLSFRQCLCLFSARLSEVRIACFEILWFCQVHFLFFRFRLGNSGVYSVAANLCLFILCP